MSPAMLPAFSSKPIIPAWKRVGLKLKSAQQASEPYEVSVVTAPITPGPKKEKRKRDAADYESPHAKKINQSAKVHEPPMDTTPTQSPITSSLKRRKSVSFTPETKTQDGDSAVQLYKGWIAKNHTRYQNFPDVHSRQSGSAPGPSLTIEQIDSVVIEDVLREVEGVKKPKKEKLPKKLRTAKSHKVVKALKQSDPALSYLKQFHDSKETWKFNKIHQIHLLKNTFDVEKIPSDYIELFYTYVAGLKGSARIQLRDAAIAIKIKHLEESSAISADDMDGIAPGHDLEAVLKENTAIVPPDPSSKIGYEESVLQSFADLTIKKRMAKRMRAERILDEFCQEAEESGEGLNGSSESVKEEDGDRESQKRLKLVDGSTQKLRRRRKQRTTAVDDSSSSDSSDSDSNSEDEEEKSEPSDDESSSSSSSSSSGSEDDEVAETSGSEDAGGSD